MKITNLKNKLITGLSLCAIGGGIATPFLVNNGDKNTTILDKNVTNFQHTRQKSIDTVQSFYDFVIEKLENKMSEIINDWQTWVDYDADYKYSTIDQQNYHMMSYLKTKIKNLIETNNFINDILTLTLQEDSPIISFNTNNEEIKEKYNIDVDNFEFDFQLDIGNTYTNSNIFYQGYTIGGSCWDLTNNNKKWFTRTQDGKERIKFNFSVKLKKEINTIKDWWDLTGIKTWSEMEQNFDIFFFENQTQPIKMFGNNQEFACEPEGFYNDTNKFNIKIKPFVGNSQVYVDIDISESTLKSEKNKIMSFFYTKINEFNIQIPKTKRQAENFEFKRYSKNDIDGFTQMDFLGLNDGKTDNNFKYNIDPTNTTQSVSFDIKIQAWTKETVLVWIQTVSFSFEQKDFYNAFENTNKITPKEINNNLEDDVVFTTQNLKNITNNYKIEDFFNIKEYINTYTTDFVSFETADFLFNERENTVEFTLIGKEANSKTVFLQKVFKNKINTEFTDDELLNYLLTEKKEEILKQTDLLKTEETYAFSYKNNNKNNFIIKKTIIDNKEYILISTIDNSTTQKILTNSENIDSNKPNDNENNNNSSENNNPIEPTPPINNIIQYNNNTEMLIGLGVLSGILAISVIALTTSLIINKKKTKKQIPVENTDN